MASESREIMKIHKKAKKLCIIAISFLFGISLIITSKAQDYMDSLCEETLEKMHEFVFISEIGAMVGGSTAISNSKYISISGLIQVSKEENNGTIHNLMTGYGNTNEFFRDLSEDFDSCPKWNMDEKGKKPGLVTEYYPPTTLMAYSFLGHDNLVCKYFGEVSNNETAGKFINRVSAFVTRTELTSAPFGLYIRASHIINPKLNLIKFDLELKRSELSSYDKLNQVIKNQMAMVRVGNKNQLTLIADNVAIIPGKPIHVRIGNNAYLIFPYNFDPEI